MCVQCLFGIFFSFQNLANKPAKTLAIVFQHIFNTFNTLDQTFVSYTAPTTSTDHFYHNVILKFF